MKGYVYICEMIYKDELYYKIGRALNVAKREAGLKIGNPFLSVVAVKQTSRYESIERAIQNSVKNYHFSGEWYKLTKEQYQALYESNGFSDYTDAERENQLKYGYHSLALFRKSVQCKGPRKIEDFHVFRKPRKLKSGETLHKWYYYFYQDGKKIQKVCPDCRSRSEAESFIRTLPSLAEVN